MTARIEDGTLPTEGNPMDAAAVRQAVTELKAQGGRVSVRAIHAKIGGSVREISHWLHECAAEGVGGEAAEEVAGIPDEGPRPLTPLQRAQEAVKAAEARVQALQVHEDRLVIERRELQRAMTQARESHDPQTLATLLSREPALTQVLNRVQAEKRDALTAVQQARAGVQEVYRDASPTARQFQAVRARVQALQQAMHHHGRELTRCQAELPPQQRQLDALGRELREHWGVEEPA
jgi:hypothetical protein